MAGLAWPQHVAFLDDRHLRREILAAHRRAGPHAVRAPGAAAYRHRQRNPPGRRALARPAPRRAVHPRSFRRGAHRRARYAAHVRQLPADRVSRTAVSRRARVQCVSARRGGDAGIHGTAAPHRRPPAAAARGVRSRQSAARPRGAGVARRHAGTRRVQRGRVRRGRLRRGPTNGGEAVRPFEDWSFGLVDRERRPKAALAAVSQAFRAAPYAPSERRDWPAVSVVVCAYNAAGTIDDCLNVPSIDSTTRTST